MDPILLCSFQENSYQTVLNHAFIVFFSNRNIEISSTKTVITSWYFKSDLKVRRQAVAIHSSLLESRNFDGNEGMREAVQRVQDLEKQLLGTIDIFCLWKGDVGKEKGKTSRFPVDFGTESNEVCNLVKDEGLVLFFWIVSTVVTFCCTWKKGNGLHSLLGMNRRVE